ncbi:MAG: hypothetical protein IPJ82_20035 [Lewinellaceae bacterium]|nr:hypothetical protein [Lewinellaceae bacterium]
MKFNIGDYVRVKSGVLLEETDEEVPGWVGRIVELHDNPKDPFYLLELDAVSLDNLPEKYLQDCIDEQESPLVYYFQDTDLEPAERRDTDEVLRATQDRISDLVMGPDEESEIDKALLGKWIAAFKQSAQAALLNDIEREEAEYIIDNFAEFAFNYSGEQVGAWTHAGVQEVCIELIPRKVTAEAEYFDRVGPVLARFFDFLGEADYLPKAAALGEEVRRISPKIAKNAADPHKWGMAKSLGMMAMQTGVDLSNEMALQRFIMEYNAGINTAQRPKQTTRPAKSNPYMNIPRNQIIRVKYADGSIREGKFKRLEADLLEGKCELVK